MAEVISHIVDEDSFEIHPDFAANIITGFAHIDGRSVAIIANQPMVLAVLISMLHGKRTVCPFCRCV